MGEQNISYMPDFDEMDEPYFEYEDQGYGTCPDCGSYLYNGGAVSDGDGDLYDELICPTCQEQMGRANERWFDADGNAYDDYDEMCAYGTFYDDYELPSLWYRVREFFAWLPVKVKRLFGYRLEQLILHHFRHCADCGKRGVKPHQWYCDSCSQDQRHRF